MDEACFQAGLHLHPSPEHRSAARLRRVALAFLLGAEVLRTSVKCVLGTAVVCRARNVGRGGHFRHARNTGS
jgi:hypothetical protein